jgi:uncharacterized C2H2 Zn-finger protein
MAKTQTLLKALGTLTQNRRSLERMTRRVADEERQVMESIERMLSGLGYRLIAVNGRAGKVAVSKGSPVRRRHLARQNLKCPKCDRRFGFVMHLARHMNTVHSAKKRGSKKAAAA